MWALLESVKDPEIPVVSLPREMESAVREVEAGGLEVVITPTYSGCPAMSQMHDDASRRACPQPEFPARVVLQRGWSTDWMTPEANAKLRAYGIAAQRGALRQLGRHGCAVCDPQGCRRRCRCGFLPAMRLRKHHRNIAFRIDGVQALYRCLACMEPFDCANLTDRTGDPIMSTIPRCDLKIARISPETPAPWQSRSTFRKASSETLRSSLANT